MSDHDAAPDPMDKAYAQAEALLHDERERAARRARVLAAVASEPATADAPRPRRHLAWGPVGALAAAGLAGLVVLVATRVDQPALTPPPVPASPPQAAAVPPPDELASPPAAAPQVAAAPTAVARPAPTPQPAQAADAAAPKAEAMTQPEPPAVAAPAPLAERRPASRAAAAPAPPSPPPPPAAAGVSDSSINELVVTGSRIEGSRQDAPARLVAPLGSRAKRIASLREAAAAGRTDEVSALLATGIPVDTPDEDGETALMKSIQAGQPEVAALLKRRGASLDLKNREGVSARDMARSMDDEALNKALGLTR